MHLNLGHILCILSVACSAALVYAGITAGLAVHTVQITKLQTDLGVIQSDVSRMSGDVAYLRGQLGIRPRGDLLVPDRSAEPPPG